MNNIYLEEISNIQNVKNVFEKLKSISQNKEVDFDDKDNICIRRIIFNNQLMLILNVLEMFNGKSNFSDEISTCFLEFFKNKGIQDISSNNIQDYISLLRNAIAHHDDIIYEFSNEKSNKLKIMKYPKNPYDKCFIDLDLTIEDLQGLINSLTNIFYENENLKKYFNYEIDLNNSLNNILNGNKDNSIDSISIDLSYLFYISQLFEMTRFTKPQSLNKELKRILIKDEELNNLIYGISSNNSEKNSRVSFEDILNNANINNVIKQNILFFYNSYPNEVKRIFGDSFRFNNKSIETLLEEYSDQFINGIQNNKNTDFQDMIENVDDSNDINKCKKDLIFLFLNKLPQSNRLIQLGSEDDVTLLSLFKMLNELKITSDNNGVQYFSTSKLTNEYGEIMAFSFFDKIRNATIHSMVDFILDDKGQVFYAFQDVNNKDNDKETSYILSYISSEQLNSILNIGFNYLELYKRALNEVEKNKDYSEPER